MKRVRVELANGATMLYCHIAEHVTIAAHRPNGDLIRAERIPFPATHDETMRARALWMELCLEAMGLLN